MYGKEFPLFARKVDGNVLHRGSVSILTVCNYLRRQISYYEEIEGMIDASGMDRATSRYLFMVEKALEYRAMEQKKKKEERRAKRKQAKASANA